jgi:hypothetical protein
MFATPAEPYEIEPELEKALDLLLILHADHEQNCSTSTVRLAGSVQAALVDVGERLELSDGEEREYLEKLRGRLQALERGQPGVVVRLSPQVRSAPLGDAIPAIPYAIRAIPTLHRVTRALQLAALAAASSAAHDSP